MPSKLYNSAVIALAALSTFMTACKGGSQKDGETDQQLELLLRVQCDTWARELESAAEAYEAHAKAGASSNASLPLGTTARERALTITRVIGEQRLCRSVRKRAASDDGVMAVSKAGETLITSDDPMTLAGAVRQLADAAKRDATLEIGP